MKASDFIANFLSKYSNYAFGGQGSSVIHIVDSIYKHKSINFIPGQSEQGSSLAADAYYRSSKKIGVTIGTSGPGILNFLQGMACSYFDSVPGLYIAGAPVVNHLRKNKKIRQIGFQEMEVQNMVKPICKYSTLVKKIEDLNYELEKCIDIAFSGRKGPTLIEIPDDISRMNMPKKLKHFKSKIKNDLKKINYSKIIELLKKSERPLIVVGNGCLLSDSIEDSKRFIKNNKIPYTASWAVLHHFSSSDPLNVGSFGVAATRHGNFAVQKADLIIFLGARLSTQMIGGNITTFAPNAKKVIVDIDKEEFSSQRLPKIELKINYDVKKFLKGLNKIKLIKKTNDIKIWVDEINILKKNYPILSKNNLKNKKFVDPYFFFNNFYSNIKKNSIVIPDASANLIWSYQTLKTDKNPEMFTAFNHSPMGYSLAASVGAFYGSKNKKVYALIGDGSVPMNVQELETIKNYDINSIIIVLNNQGYGLIKQTQETWLKSIYAGTDKSSGLSLPNNIKVASSYGIKSFVLKNNNDIKKNLKRILNLKGPILVDVMIDPKSRVKPKIEFGKPLHDMYPYISRSRLTKIMKK
jgi:acetolactate synthase-1/2/3 large subunit